MIYYQIEDVDVMFKDLEELEAQNWVVVKEPAKNPPTKAKKLVKKVTTKPKAAKKSPSKATTSLKEMMAAKRREMKEKFELYEASGVQEYWLVNPLDKSIIIYTLQNGRYIGFKPFVPDEVVFSSVLEGFELAVAAVFEV